MNTINQLKKILSSKKEVDVAIMIHGFTGFRTTLLEELTEDEAQRLLSIHSPKEKDLEAENNELKYDILRSNWISNILKLAEEIGIKDKGSFDKFNHWMFNSSKFKKHLNALTIEEMIEIHKQLHAVKMNNARSAHRPMTKAWWDKAEKNVKLN